MNAMTRTAAIEARENADVALKTGWVIGLVSGISSSLGCLFDGIVVVVATIDDVTL